MAESSRTKSRSEKYVVFFFSLNEFLKAFGLFLKQ